MSVSSTLWLVGAGPGDPDLITIKAVKTLRNADVVLYDALVNEELLSYAPLHAIKLFAGKRMGCHYLSQQEINQLIADYGKTHRNVVRLKGGDPFVFGRAHEEIMAARQAGMQVQVISGISSAIAVPASQLIPLTCRGINESFWVITGTTQSGEISPDIALAARSSSTVILLMAMSKLEQIMDVFRDAGKEHIPVAIIQNGTTREEKTITGTVRDICFKAQLEGFANPSVVIIGEVVSLRSILSEAQTNTPGLLSHRQDVIFTA